MHALRGVVAGSYKKARQISRYVCTLYMPLVSIVEVICMPNFFRDMQILVLILIGILSDIEIRTPNNACLLLLVLFIIY